MPDDSCLKQVEAAVIDGDDDAAVDAARRALDEGFGAQKILAEGLMSGAEEIGRRFERGEYFLPELMMSGQALKAAMEILRPALAEDVSTSTGPISARIIAATIQSDIHDIGKNIVVSMLTAAGFDVMDLGVDVPIKNIIDRAEEAGANIIALSALLTTSMPFMRDLIDLLDIRGLRGKYMVMVGGAPVTEEWAKSIGADGTARNAADAVRLARSLIAAR